MIAIGAGRSATDGADGGRGKRADQELPLGADVEQPGLEPEADGQAAEDQRRGGDQGVGDRVQPCRTRRGASDEYAVNGSSRSNVAGR